VGARGQKKKEPNRATVVPHNREKIAGRTRKADDERHSLYSLPNTIKEIKSRGMGWARHVAHMVEINACKLLLENIEWTVPLGRCRCTC
jgi:hypothetical protein